MACSSTVKYVDSNIDTYDDEIHLKTIFSVCFQSNFYLWIIILNEDLLGCPLSLHIFVKYWYYWSNLSSFYVFYCDFVRTLWFPVISRCSPNNSVQCFLLCFAAISNDLYDLNNSIDILAMILIYFILSVCLSLFIFLPQRSMIFMLSIDSHYRYIFIWFLWFHVIRLRFSRQFLVASFDLFWL